MRSSGNANGTRAAGTSVARDGQGLEVSNAGVEAIAALDFLKDEWLGFGNRLAEFITAADKDQRCALLPVMAANLMLSMNSAEGLAAAQRYLARARQFRNGLMVALEALHPIRLKNFAALEIGRTFKKVNKAWWIVLSASETKEKLFTVDVTSSNLFRCSPPLPCSKFCTAEKNSAPFIKLRFSGTDPTSPQFCRSEEEAGRLHRWSGKSELLTSFPQTKRGRANG